jgi:hypothetical protein
VFKTVIVKVGWPLLTPLGLAPPTPRCAHILVQCFASRQRHVVDGCGMGRRWFLWSLVVRPEDELPGRRLPRSLMT